MFFEMVMGWFKKKNPTRPDLCRTAVISSPVRSGVISSPSREGVVCEH